MISCFPTGVVNLKRPEQGVSSIVSAGFESILLDLNMGCSEQVLEQMGKPRGNRDDSYIAGNPSDMGKVFEKMVGSCQGKELKIPVVYAPYLLRDTQRTDMQEVLTNLMEEGIRICGKTGSRYIVVRPMFAGIETDDEWGINREYYLHLAKLAREHKVMILLENQCRNVNGHMVRGICSNGSTAAKWVDMLNEECGEECFGFCMNAGTCSLCGQDMHEFAVDLGSRIKAVILRDCDGHNESSMLPFTSVYHRQSQTDWLGLVRGLREIGFDGELVLDITDTAAAFSSVIRPQLLSFAKSVAEYFKWQIGIENQLKKYKSIVLFGAGNMCRNYMKCYGQKYPPLFTCDNNKALWGTSFSGLEVKPPEALKDIPDECGVFICNIYYREIEKQLRDIGISNVEFFSDEYMPSFYFDRLEMW